MVPGEPQCCSSGWQSRSCGEKEVDKEEVGVEKAEVTCVVLQGVMGSGGRGCGWTRRRHGRLAAAHRLAGLLPTRTRIWRDRQIQQAVFQLCCVVQHITEEKPGSVGFNIKISHKHNYKRVTVKPVNTTREENLGKYYLFVRNNKNCCMRT